MRSKKPLLRIVGEYEVEGDVMDASCGFDSWNDEDMLK